MTLLGSLWLILVAALLGYAFLLGLLRRVNEWYYVSRLQGKLQHPLPPGHLGWPLLGNMPTFLRAFKSNPDSYIYDLVSRSLFSSTHMHLQVARNYYYYYCIFQDHLLFIILSFYYKNVCYSSKFVVEHEFVCNTDKLPWI